MDENSIVRSKSTYLDAESPGIYKLSLILSSIWQPKFIIINRALIIYRINGCEYSSLHGALGKYLDLLIKKKRILKLHFKINSFLCNCLWSKMLLCLDL